VSQKLVFGELSKFTKHEVYCRYAALFAGSPTVSKVHDTDQGEMDDHLFFRRLLGMTKKENFVKGMNANRIS